MKIQLNGLLQLVDGVHQLSKIKIIQGSILYYFISKRQKIFFSFRTDGTYDENNNTWKSVPSQLVIANIDIPNPGY